MSKKTKYLDFIFPETIYVGVDKCDEDNYLIADKSYEGLEVQNDDRTIAVYQLVKVKTLRNQSILI